MARRPSASKLLDGIVRGRAWIPVLGVLLVGIVGMRVEVLKLGSSVGAELQQAAQLQSANAVMESQVSALSDNQRIQKLASQRGMVMPGPLDVHFVKASGPASVSKAIADIRPPSPTTFLSGLVSERAEDGASATAAENHSAVGVLGGASINSGSTTTVSSSGGDQTTTTLTVSPSSPDSAGTPASDTPVTGTAAPTTDPGDAGSTAPATDASDAGSTAPATDASDASATGDTGNTAGNSQPTTDAGTNGAASLAG